MALKLSVVPEKAVVVQRDKVTVAASWFGPFVVRPYIYPFLAPGDIEVVRLGHPNDPVGHSHHRGIWIGHASVGGVNFWGDLPEAGRIEQREIVDRQESGEQVGALLRCVWRSASGDEILREARRLTFSDLAGGELALDIDTSLEPAGESVEIGVSNFGLLGIRVTRTMRVLERLGGLIQNSEEAENEAGCFGQHATWCDLSGPELVSSGGETPEPAVVLAGIACFDHPANPGEGVQWHVRDDGWMGPSLTRSAAITIRRGQPLRVRYRIIAHAGRPADAGIGDRYRAWRKGQAGE